MTLHGKQLLRDFVQKHADAQSQLESWEAEAEDATWKTPHELKTRYPKASILGNQQTIFDICGDKYRLWVKINYQNGIVLIKNIGTHSEYNKWDIA